MSYFEAYRALISYCFCVIFIHYVYPLALLRSLSNLLLHNSKPQSYMFSQMRFSSLLPSTPPPSLSSALNLSCPETLPNTVTRSALGISRKTDILEHISSLPLDEQPAAHGIIRGIESAAMQDQEPQPGLEELIGYLEKREVRMGICTRNFEYV